MNRDPASNHTIRFDAYDPGRYVQQGGYESFMPSQVNHGWTWTDARINTPLEDATRALIEFDAFSRCFTGSPPSTPRPSPIIWT